LAARRIDVAADGHEQPGQEIESEIRGEGIEPGGIQGRETCGIKGRMLNERSGGMPIRIPASHAFPFSLLDKGLNIEF